MSITLRQLEIFIAVVECQQVTRASKKLFLTQSAVSMALGELENQLGGPLFDRHGRSLILNDRGRYLLPLSKEILYQVGNIEALMTESKDTVAGTLNVVASSTLGNYVLPYLIGTFMRMNPLAHVNMLVYNTKAAVSLVQEGKMDLGFIEGACTAEEVVTDPWFMDELVVVLSPADKLASRKSFRVPQDLTDTSWIMREQGSGTAQNFKHKLGSHAGNLRVIMELGHTEAIKKAIEAGAGIGCLSSLTVCREIEQGWLTSLPFEGIDMRRELSVIHHRDRAKTHLMEEFISFCDVMSECGHGRACLSSPWKLQSLISQHLRAQELGNG
ncbi:MAG: LysR family transcriptional regulator [Desulfobulbaceae bacterium A2]|nr:MAG: LysR family transcriptional regulator [Desulfobulbaceae bacterium A2]